MLFSLRQANIVILAHKFNPTIVSKEWLAKREIVTEPAINFAHTEVFSLVETQNFTLVLDETRLQVALRRPTREALQELSAGVGNFVKQLPETPYRAVGLNLGFAVAAASFDLSPVLTPATENLEKLLGEGYEIGARLTFEFQGYLVKAELPQSVTPEGYVEITFNFHADVASVDQVLERLASYSNVLEKAEQIVTEVARVG